MSCFGGKENKMNPKIYHELASFLDEDRIVTYKWLSDEMKLSAAEAKELMESYRKRNKDETRLTAIYCVIGFEKNSSANQRVLLVRENDLDKVKSQLRTGSSQHVYSLQKINLRNSNSIYMVDSEVKDWHHTFCIKESEELPRQEHQKLQKQPPISQPKPSAPAQVQPLKEIKSKVDIKTEPQIQEKKTVLTKLQNEKPKASKRSKQNEPSVNKLTKKKSEPSKPSVHKLTKKKSEPVKRKRLRQLSTSSSDSSDDDRNDEENETNNLNLMQTNDFDSEDPVPPSPEKQNEITLRQNQHVNQSFVDDEGYLVTTKVCKVVEEKVLTTNATTKTEKKVPQPVARGKKKSQQNNNKQATLMSYFKKP